MQNTQELEEQFEGLTFSTIKISSMSQQRGKVFAYLNIRLSNRNGIHRLLLKIDTGAQGNILPITIFRRMFSEKLDSNDFPKWKTKINKSKLIAYNGTPIKCFSSISIPCKYNSSDWQNSTFYIVDAQGPDVLGLPSLEQFKLFTLHSPIKKTNINH